MADSLLQTLCTLRGISGNEEAVRDFIRTAVQGCGECEETPLGGLLVYKKGRKRAKTRLLLDAHMDEVGLIVTRVTDDGLLQFTPVGGIDPRVLAGKSVLVGSEGRCLSGVIGVKPIHVTDRADRQKTIPTKALAIDIGAKYGSEAASLVQLGDMVTFDSPFVANGYSYLGRALDDRAGCALLIHLLQDPDWEYDTVFSFSVQEEIGCRGARTHAYRADPQAAIVVESTTAADVAGNEAEAQVCRLGAGPVISFMDRSTVYDKTYCKWAFQEAERLQLPCQWKEAVAGGNDAGSIHQSRGGVRSVGVSLPCRYLHAPMGMIRQSDYEAALPLLKALAARIAGADPAAR